MSKPEFTQEGVEIQTFSEVFDELSEGYKDVYGQDINIDQDTPDGQKIGIEAKLSHDMQQFAAALYAQLDPDFSAGDILNKLIKWAGITRKPATRSSAVIDVETNAIVTLEAGYRIADEMGQTWLTEDEIIVNSGTTQVTFFAKNFGEVDAPANTINSFIDILPNVLSVNNPSAAIAGVDEETSEELRVRRNKSTENPSYSTIGGLQAKLGDLEGVTDVLVYENDTDVYDPVLDLNAHHFWCVIEGGAINDIAETIVKQKTGGAGLKGNNEANYIEEILRPNGTIRTIVHTVKYDAPTIQQLYIKCDAAKRNPTDVIDVDLIKSEITKREYSINEDATATELYMFGYQAGSTFILTDMQISDDGITYTDSDLQADFDGKWFIDVANIAVTEI